MEYVGYLSACFVLCLVVGLVCAASEGDVRLNDGYSNSNQGRVEVFHEGTWGTVCGQDWGSQEATVICRQLNLGDVLLSKAFFGNGSGPILVGTHCHDHDFHLNECHGTWEEVPSTCTHQEDVAVICYPVDYEEAPTGLTIGLELIIVIAMGVFCWLVIKMVTFVENSKVDDEEVAVHEVRTDDHPHAASQHVSISDECDVSARKDDVTTSKHGVTASKNDVTTSKDGGRASKDEVTASKDDVTTSKDEVTSSKNDAAAEKDDVTASKNVATASKNDVTTSNDEVTASKDEVTASKDDVASSENGARACKNDVTTSKNDVIISMNGVNSNENYEIDERHISVDKSTVIQTADVAVQTLQ